MYTWFNNEGSSFIGLPSAKKLQPLRRLFESVATLIAVCGICVAASEARADLFTVGEDNVTVSPFTFNQPPAGGFVPNQVQIETSSVANQWRSPFEGVIGQEADPFTTIQAGFSATYTFAAPQASLQMLWGSPDSYNTIEFLNGATPVFSLTGSGLHPITFGLGHDLVTFTDTTGAFTAVVLSSTQNAFEFADLISTPVGSQGTTPLPAALPLYVAGVGIVGLVGWRRRRKQTGNEA
jgi:hypothetical protein